MWMFDIGHLPSRQSAKCSLFLVGKDMCLRMSDCSKHSSRYTCLYFQPQRQNWVFLRLLISRKSLGWLYFSSWWESGFRGYSMRYFQWYWFDSSTFVHVERRNSFVYSRSGRAPWNLSRTHRTGSFHWPRTEGTSYLSLLLTLSDWKQWDIIGESVRQRNAHPASEDFHLLLMNTLK